MVNQIAIVLNFSLSVCLRFAFAEPIVIIAIAIIIIKLCSIPKSGFLFDELRPCSYAENSPQLG